MVTAAIGAIDALPRNCHNEKFQFSYAINFTKISINFYNNIIHKIYAKYIPQHFSEKTRFSNMGEIYAKRSIFNE